MEMGVHRHQRFQVQPRRSSTWMPISILLLWILLRATLIKIVWPPQSQYACSQVSAVLFYTEVRAGTNLWWQYVCFYPTSEGSATSYQLKHWSGNCRVSQTCSASPVPEKWMCKRNTTLLKVQRSNFKSLGKNWGGPGRPSRPTSEGHAK